MYKELGCNEKASNLRIEIVRPANMSVLILNRNCYSKDCDTKTRGLLFEQEKKRRNSRKDRREDLCLPCRRVGCEGLMKGV